MLVSGLTKLVNEDPKKKVVQNDANKLSQICIRLCQDDYG